MPSLTGKTVLVTGASRGVGFEIVRSLGAHGARVIAQYNSLPEGAAEAAVDIAEGDKLLLPADFGRPGASQALWEEALAWQGGIDAVVCNAAIMPEASLDVSDEEWAATWQTALQVNTIAPADLVRQATLYFAGHGGGIIVGLSSWAAQRGAGNPRLSAYAGSKAGFAAMLKTVARSYASDGVLAYLIAPGVVRTDMSVRSARSQGGEEAVSATLAMGEWVPPEEIGELTAVLCEGRLRHLTGATLDVNGASYVR